MLCRYAVLNQGHGSFIQCSLVPYMVCLASLRRCVDDAWYKRLGLRFESASLRIYPQVRVFVSMLLPQHDTPSVPAPAISTWSMRIRQQWAGEECDDLMTFSTILLTPLQWPQPLQGSVSRSNLRESNGKSLTEHRILPNVLLRQRMMDRLHHSKRYESTYLRAGSENLWTMNQPVAWSPERQAAHRFWTSRWGRTYCYHSRGMCTWCYVDTLPRLWISSSAKWWPSRKPTNHRWEFHPMPTGTVFQCYRSRRLYQD